MHRCAAVSRGARRRSDRRDTRCPGSPTSMESGSRKRIARRWSGVAATSGAAFEGGFRRQRRGLRPCAARSGCRSCGVNPQRRADAARPPTRACPMVSTARATVDNTNYVSQAVTNTTDPERASAIEIRVNARRFPGIDEGTITQDSFDWGMLQVEVAKSAGRVPYREKVGLWWGAIVLRTIAPLGTTGLTLHIRGRRAHRLSRSARRRSGSWTNASPTSRNPHRPAHQPLRFR